MKTYTCDLCGQQKPFSEMQQPTSPFSLNNSTFNINLTINIDPNSDVCCACVDLVFKRLQYALVDKGGYNFEKKER